MTRNYIKIIVIKSLIGKSHQQDPYEELSDPSTNSMSPSMSSSDSESSSNPASDNASTLVLAPVKDNARGQGQKDEFVLLTPQLTESQRLTQYTHSHQNTLLVHRKKMIMTRTKTMKMNEDHSSHTWWSETRQSTTILQALTNSSMTSRHNFFKLHLNIPPRIWVCLLVS